MKKIILYSACCILLLINSGCYDDLSSGGFEFADFRGGIAAEQYNDFEENPFLKVSEHPVSTFSIDADGASYSNVRRFLNYPEKPPKEAVRTEELLNYFTFDYPDDNQDHPVTINGEMSVCPWNDAHQLIRIGLKGKEISREDLPGANFVLLVDVSGSMQGIVKLELLKEGFINFVNGMRPQDKIAIVTYAGKSGVALNATSGDQKSKIINKIRSLSAGGSTAGADGINTAYKIAQANFIEGGNNRVILGTDGDFNVGVSSQKALVDLIEKKRENGIFLTVLGYGIGNLNEAMMEQLANHGNGNYEYIDNLAQSDKVFIHEYEKFYSVAKDVKIQIKFNQTLVEEYRLIGYENRLLQEEDFEDDGEDAGEIGAGQTITALYEVKMSNTIASRALPAFIIDLRYKKTSEEQSQLITLAIDNEGKSFSESSENMRFAASLAGYGMLLRDSPYKNNLTYDDIYSWVTDARSFDPQGYRDEFLNLILMAKNL